MISAHICGEADGGGLGRQQREFKTYRKSTAQVRIEGAKRPNRKLSEPSCSGPRYSVRSAAERGLISWFWISWYNNTYRHICRAIVPVFLDRESRRIIAVDPVHCVKVVVRGPWTMGVDIVRRGNVNAQQYQFHVCTNWLGDVVSAVMVVFIRIWVAWWCYDAAGIGEVATTVATFS